jgi:hypothetical protein
MLSAGSMAAQHSRQTVGRCAGECYKQAGAKGPHKPQIHRRQCWLQGCWNAGCTSSSQQLNRSPLFNLVNTVSNAYPNTSYTHLHPCGLVNGQVDCGGIATPQLLGTHKLVHSPAGRKGREGGGSRRGQWWG